MEEQYLTPSQAGALMDPPRSGERVRQLIKQGDLPYTPAETVLRGVASRLKYLIRPEDLEVFLKQYRPWARKPKAQPVEEREPETVAVA